MNTLNEAISAAAETLVEHHLNSTSKTPGASTTLCKDGAFILIASGDLAREFQMMRELGEAMKRAQEVGSLLKELEKTFGFEALTETEEVSK